MTPRERVTAAINRRWPDRCPKEAGFTPALLEAFQRETGSGDPAAYFGMEPRSVGFRGPEEVADFSAYYRGLPEGAHVTSEYGTGAVPGTFYHFARYVFPLRNAASVADVERYPWPNITPEYRHAHLEAEVEALHAQDHFVDGFAGHVFETAWQLLGLERTLSGFIEEPDVVEAVLERITEDACFRARRLAEAGVDMLRTGDDVGMQDRLMMRPELWRRFLKPRLARVIASARRVRPDLPVWYHSDGDVTAIISDLIDVGVTVLNPVQPECMDLHMLRREYGSRLAFWGTIGTQTVMPFGTPEDVRRAVREMIDLFAPGLVLAPTHVLEPDVPWANVQAFFQAVEEQGRYA